MDLPPEELTDLLPVLCDINMKSATEKLRAFLADKEKQQ